MTTGLRRARTAVRHRGGPLVMLALLLSGWCGARVMWWEDPFAAATHAKAQAPALAEAALLPALLPATALPMLVPVDAAVIFRATGPSPEPRARFAGIGGLAQTAPAGVGNSDPAPPGAPRAHPAERPERGSALLPPPPPFLAAPLAAPRTTPQNRWSLDSWAFWRQGSASTPVSQGRVPIYGASQAGAVLQYRFAPSSRHDPRLYARAYRALVRRGESEGALGASLRPLGGLPLRLAGEVRYTDAAFFNDVRPAAYAVTELAPLRLPFGTALEAYGQAGWVGGPGETAFADGQASVTRELPALGRATGDRLRLSLGAGAWGGAQRDAERVDVGPTLRLDTRIGQVPARVSVDWRLRVAGDASPGAGVAATVSAGF